MTDDKLTIEDLLIRRSLPERGLRDATEADLLAVLEGLGAEGVEWCEEHFESAWSLDECWKQVYGEDEHYVGAGSPCRIATYLVWGPL